MRFRWTPAIVALACLTIHSARAQVVRGRITEAASGAPIAGAVVTLERSSGEAFPDQARYSVLSGDNGAWSLRVPEPGTYRVTVKRIGVKRAESAAFTLGAGETKRVDLALEAVLQTLPEIVVHDLDICSTKPDEHQQVAALWDEASTLLIATRIAVRDTLFRAGLLRYTRALDPRTLRVKSETRETADKQVNRPFRSLSADSLHLIGYWRDVGEETTEFYGLDADAITSLAFRRDHCFHVAEKDPDHPGMIGLAFEPGPQRTLPDVRGTLWLDAKTFELHSVQFEYTQLESDHGVDHLGGEVFFARLPNGIWIVRRWYLRMPQYQRKELTKRGVETLPFPHLAGVVEEGGQVTAAGMTIFERPAVITGTVTDSLGARVANGLVNLAGTSYETRTDAQGRYQLDSLPPGAFDLVYDDPGYHVFGVPPALEEVALDEGRSITVNLRAGKRGDIAATLCSGHRPAGQQGALRVTVLDTLTGATLGALRLRVSWQEYGQQLAVRTKSGRPSPDPASAAGPGFPTVHNQEAIGTTDHSGVVMFCELPSRKPLELSLSIDADHNRRLTNLSLKDGDLVAKVVRIRR